MMKNFKKIAFFVALNSCWFVNAQENVTKSNKSKENVILETNSKGINSINNGMPNRISMNVTVPKQTQGATFGEKTVTNQIKINLIENACIVLFPLNSGYKINLIDNSINELKGKEYATFGEKVNQGLHATGSALSQGASLLGGALPGGNIISAAVSSVSSLSGSPGGGASAAAYAKSAKEVYSIKDEDTDTVMNLADGEYELVFVVLKNTNSGIKDTLKTQVRIGFSVEKGILKTKHDTVKNSISNIR